MSREITEAYNFGHAVDWCEKRKTWFLVETGDSNTIETYMNLICPKCKKLPTKDAHDPCIKNLPGVKFACCGHGVSEGYIWFENGVIVRGNFEIEYDFGEE